LIISNRCGIFQKCFLTDFHDFLPISLHFIEKRTLLGSVQNKKLLTSVAIEKLNQKQFDINKTTINQITAFFDSPNRMHAFSKLTGL